MRANLFILPLDPERRWYRYHHLFSDLLRLLLEKAHPGHSIDLHRRACYWYETQDMIPAALQHAISSGDLQLVAQIVSANVLVLVENDEVIPTLHKIDSLPPTKITALPWLGIARAWVLGAGHIQQSLEILDTVEISVENAPTSVERQRLKGHIAAARAFVFCAQGETIQTIEYARLANELLPANEIAVRAMNLTRWGDVLIDSQKDFSALPILEQALALALHAKKPHVAMIASAALASAYMHAGMLYKTQHTCLDALVIAEEYQTRNQHPLSVTAEIYSILARVLAEWGEYDQAIQFARKGLTLSEHLGLVSIKSLCLSHLGRILVLGNELEQARQAFQRAESAAQKISIWFWQVTTIFALDTLLDSEAPDASEIAQQMRRVQESGAQYSPLLSARLLLKENQPDQALARLEQAQVESKGQPSCDTVRIHALCALAYQAKGDENQALVALRQALELGEPENRVMAFVREGAEMERLLHMAQAEGVTSEFVCRLLAVFESRRKDRPVLATPSRGLLEPLSPRELDVLKLLAQGCADKQIAEILIISRGTVHKHLQNIYEKLNVHSRTEAIAHGRALNLL